MRTVAAVAVAAEQAGWDALFVWDHVVLDKREFAGEPFGDPCDAVDRGPRWQPRLRLGTMVTPVRGGARSGLARYKSATLDALATAG
jgi:alkanesulfonate monooxygenase SsuD/methylene tetrahydromethanopterin reductase-like flavin-dependent oxidoreductase (luciferase family)